MQVNEQAVLEALANTSGWSVGPVKEHEHTMVDCLSDAEEYCLSLWFTRDDDGTQRVRAILAAIGKAP